MCCQHFEVVKLRFSHFTLHFCGDYFCAFNHLCAIALLLYIFNCYLFFRRQILSNTTLLCAQSTHIYTYSHTYTYVVFKHRSNLSESATAAHIAHAHHDTDYLHALQWNVVTTTTKNAK